MNKVFLIDGHAQIFRMYYAFMRRPMVNSKGEDVSILYGFTKMLLELITKEQPTHLAVSFDPPCATFRHIAYPQYKANRGAAPELVKAALEPLQDILKAFGIPVVMMEGFEADDVIGSMAAQWGAANPETTIYMVTPDKDYGQLITGNVLQYKPAKGDSDIEIMGPEQVCQKYGITSPNQVVDILTIWGDSSDNVPGVNGVGEVGAGKLISKYGSVENIVQHLDELSPKQREAFVQAADHLDMSKFLVTIKKDIELPVSLDDIKVKPFNGAAVGAVLGKWEFPSLKRLLPSDLDLYAPSSSAQPGDSVTPDVLLRIKECQSAQVVALAKERGYISICLVEGEEKPAGDDLFGGLVGGAESARPSLLYMAVDGSWCCEEIGGGSGESAIAVENREVLENESVLKYSYGTKQVIKALWSAGVDLNGCRERGYLQGVQDLEIMHYLVNAERSHAFGELCKIYAGDSIDGLCGRCAQQLEGCGSVQDAVGVVLYETIARSLRDELEKMNQWKLYEDIEMPLMGVLAYMEACGVKIDNAALAQYSRELSAQLYEIEQQARALAGDETINLSSPKQVGVLLFEKLKLDPAAKKSSKGGSYTTDEATLSAIADRHPVVGLILEYRALKKLLSTYIDTLPTLASPLDGKVHTTFNQALTATGRLSSTNPNLQNIPIRTERGKEIRKAFISSFAGGKMASADYSQIELRLMAHISGDSNMIAAFRSGEDVHRETAARVFGKPLEEVTKEERARAKTANFGIIYGISSFGLSQRLGMKRADSKQLIEDYFRSYPGVKSYIDSIVAKAKEQGWVETIFGRRRYLPDINSRNAVVRAFSERNAVNAPLQGSAADIIKIAMINVLRRMRRENLSSMMVLQVHDELVFDVAPGEEERIMEIAHQEMERVAALSVPLVAECNVAANWLLAH